MAHVNLQTKTIEMSLVGLLSRAERGREGKICRKLLLGNTI